MKNIVWWTYKPWTIRSTVLWKTEKKLLRSQINDTLFFGGGHGSDKVWHGYPKKWHGSANSFITCKHENVPEPYQSFTRPRTKSWGCPSRSKKGHGAVILEIQLNVNRAPSRAIIFLSNAHLQTISIWRLSVKQTVKRAEEVLACVQPPLP